MNSRARTGAAICLALVLISGLSACAQPEDCHREQVFCAALVTDTRGLDDYGLNRDAWAGLERSHADGAADQIAHIESVNPKDYEKNIAFFAEAGYDVIVTSGAGLREATLRSADLYPDSVFIGLIQPGEESPPNLIAVEFPEDQMGFLAGVMAARLTVTKTVGAVCETSGIASMWRYCEGFRAGVNHADKAVRVIVAYRDDGSRDKLFVDPDWGAATAQSLAGEGVDVVFAAGGETAVGALRAADEAGALVIGVERDHRAALGSDGSGVAASILGDAGFTVQTLIAGIKEGRPPVSTANPIEFIPSDGIFPRDLVPQIEEALAGLVDGVIKTNVTSEKP